MLVRRSLGTILGLFLVISAAPQDAPAQKVSRPARVVGSKAGVAKRAKPAKPAKVGKTAKSPLRRTTKTALRGKQKTQQQVAGASKDPIKDPGHLSQVKTRTALMSRHVYEGEPSASNPGTVNLNAAFAVLMPAGVKQREVRQLSYGNGTNTSQRVEVSGVKDGKWRGHIIGTVSVHDMAHLDWGAYRKAVDSRINADRIQVSYDHGPGTAKTVLAKGIKSDAATSVGIEVPLKKGGITRVIYDRTNATGQVVGSSDAYAGRIVEISWAGN